MSKLSSAESLTQTGYTLGTPEYMAPEQCIGANVEPRTDIYALGVLMYEALTGELPISAQSRRELLDLHQRQVPTPMRHSPAGSADPRRSGRRRPALLEEADAGAAEECDGARADARRDLSRRTPHGLPAWNEPPCSSRPCEGGDRSQRRRSHPSCTCDAEARLNGRHAMVPAALSVYLDAQRERRIGSWGAAFARVRERHLVHLPLE